MDRLLNSQRLSGEAGVCRVALPDAQQALRASHGLRQFRKFRLRELDPFVGSCVAFGLKASSARGAPVIAQMLLESHRRPLREKVPSTRSEFHVPVACRALVRDGFLIPRWSPTRIRSKGSLAQRFVRPGRRCGRPSLRTLTQTLSQGTLKTPLSSQLDEAATPQVSAPGGCCGSAGLDWRS